MAQAIVKFLDNQYIKYDGEVSKFVDGIFTIFGHGMAVGLGQALDQDDHNLNVYQGRSEQGMCHVATAFAKQNNRRKIIACSASTVSYTHLTLPRLLTCRSRWSPYH